VFSFGDNTNDDDDTVVEESVGVPRHCLPIDRAARRISHPAYLACLMDNDSIVSIRTNHCLLFAKCFVEIGLSLWHGLWTHCGGEASKSMPPSTGQLPPVLSSLAMSTNSCPLWKKIVSPFVACPLPS